MVNFVYLYVFFSPLCFLPPSAACGGTSPRTRGRLPSQSRRPCGRLASSPGGRAKFTPVDRENFVVRRSFFSFALPQTLPKLTQVHLPPPAGGTNSDRCQWQKQGAVSGAALQFLQASAAARRKNRPSARGGGTALCAVTERGGSHVYEGAVMPPCGMTERAISQPPERDSLKNPRQKRKMPAFAGIFRFMGEV